MNGGMIRTGTLYLIPTIIAEGTQDQVTLPHVCEVLKTLRYFLAEDVRTARRYFSSLKVFENLDALQFRVLNKDTAEDELPELMKPLLDGIDMGIVPEAGCPGIADPGASAVHFAHEKRIRVVPLVGPSSILLALMASGLSGQHFAFHGYLPVEEKETAKSIKEYERESKLKKQTQIFIETPYRNAKLLHNLIHYLQPGTRLCIAVNITSSQEKIISRLVRDWKHERIEMPKSPAIFLFQA
jgi:16S rRNA (cytidine1402-2'-O)-methyltransferase